MCASWPVLVIMLSNFPLCELQDYYENLVVPFYLFRIDSDESLRSLEFMEYLHWKFRVLFLIQAHDSLDMLAKPLQLRSNFFKVLHCYRKITSIT
jgi:hypothetical protein